jgi:2-iminoacetate synthase
MNEETLLPLRLTSEGKHALSFTVEGAGDDLLCRVHGGEAHVGSLALSEWRDGRAHTRCLSAEGHREEAIARHAAHTLCAAARRNVACVAGIHFEGVSRAEIEAISADAYSLARQAGATIRDERLYAELTVPGASYDRLAARRGAFVDRLDQVFGMPVSSALDTYREAISGSRADSFGGEVRIFAPLYLSNACTNDCVYCGFRRSSSYERNRLSIDEAVGEARALHSRGIRAIDLVTGEIPADPFIDYVCEATEAILGQTGITRVHLNLGSLSRDQYRRLRRAGAAGYHLYQETYDPDAYLRTHRSGGKREMGSRLEAPRRAAEAGFEYLGMGVLLGLAALKPDLTALAAHAALLREEYPGLNVGFSLPRVQTMDADPEYAPARPVSDDDFIRAMLFLRLVHPGAHLTLTTRERPEIRDLLLAFGVTKLSAGVSTAPGGYAAAPGSAGNGSREQFDVADQRSVEEIAAVVTAAGLTPVFD